MRHIRALPKRGFTLIELMIVVTILAILAALLIPALGKAQARAQRVRCLGTAKAIATSVRTYVTTWEGWTHPDPFYFTKLMGRPLKNEVPPTGTYNANAAKQCKDFRCPADSSPKLNGHGYYSSYNFLLPSSNLMTMATEPSATPMVLEVGARHPASDKSSTLSYNIVYADMGGVLAADKGATVDPAIGAGMSLFGWYTANPQALFNALAAMPSLDTANPAFQGATLNLNMILTSGGMWYNWQSWNWLAATWYQPGTTTKDVIVQNGNAAYEAPAKCVLRWEGYWKIPLDPGATPPNPPTNPMRLRTDWAGYSGSWYWIDLNDNNKIDGGETLGDIYPTLTAGKKYKVVVLWWNLNSNNCHHDWVWYWNRAGTGTYYLDYAQCFYNPSDAYVP